MTLKHFSGFWPNSYALLRDDHDYAQFLGVWLGVRPRVWLASKYGIGEPRKPIDQCLLVDWQHMFTGYEVLARFRELSGKIHSIRGDSTAVAALKSDCIDFKRFVLVEV